MNGRQQVRTSWKAAEAKERPGMVHLPGGTFAMGSDRFYPEERPVRLVRVDPF